MKIKVNTSPEWPIVHEFVVVTKGQSIAQLSFVIADTVSIAQPSLNWIKIDSNETNVFYGNIGALGIALIISSTEMELTCECNYKFAH